ncbi:MAG: hypothetical protein KDD46_08785, partial [Bdellovibrionales bacterium]|nr:hypothetical protein [Bdellovibrionales bacterium]
MMKEDVKNIIDVLEKPIRYVASQGYQNIHLVKNLSQHVQDQCVRASKTTEDSFYKNTFEKLYFLFDDYEGLENEGKKERLQKAIEAIDEIKKTPSIDFSFVAHDHPDHSLEDYRTAYTKLLS